jgi:hypothetical protein
LFKDARGIAIGERDAELKLGDDTWPSAGISLPSWDADPDLGLLEREVHNGPEEEKLATPLRERVLRFPSAPIHGLHRLGQDQVHMGPVENFHTLRLLSHPAPERKRVSRIFLMHNGLNEVRKTGLYYEIASHLIAQDKHTVCLLRPFPGHLTRCPYPGLSETPLDHYLWDGLHLFRQFLRYMIETRWLLSTIVQYSTYRCASGSGLLVERAGVKGSRLETRHLTKAMMTEWQDLYDASDKAITDHREGSPDMCDEPGKPAFEAAIRSLRKALGPRHRHDGKRFDEDGEPELHALGYSLGGFTAQSVFMSWPFLLSSCSTLLSGGAMRELAPTAFADPEEWQTVLHSLRYELDDALMDWRFQQSEKPDDALGAGINPYLFRYLKRTFYEVFEQEYRGSFQTRLVAFRQRMLFVVGGNDPIVRPQSVLDASPPDGINMLAIGGLGHFLADTPQLKVEKEQREFWIPEIARTVGLLAAAAAKKHRLDLKSTWLNNKELVPKPRKKELAARVEEMRERGSLTVPERLAVERGGSLHSKLFQRSLDDLLSRATRTKSAEAPEIKSGLLFILRNEPPTFLLGDRALKQHASALYHDDVSIVDYIENVRARRVLISDEKTRHRICMLLPGNLETLVRDIDAGLQHPSQSESSGEMGAPRNPELLWEELRGECESWGSEGFEETVRVFHAPDGVEEVEDPPRGFSKLSAVARDWLGLDEESPIKPSLPDCWIWMSNKFLGFGEDVDPQIEDSPRRLCLTLPRHINKGGTRSESEQAEREIAKSLQEDDLRIVAVSRSRYNPRFRGRIVAEPRQAQELLLRAALCIVASKPFGEPTGRVIGAIRQ